jgi:hypothetical protein
MTESFYEGVQHETHNPDGFYQGEEIANFESFVHEPEHETQQAFEEYENDQPVEEYENETQEAFEQLENESHQAFEEYENESHQAFEHAVEEFEEQPFEEYQQLDNVENFQNQKLVNAPVIRCRNTTGRYIYSVFHTIMALVAIYLSFRCNKEFKWTSFIIALFFPYIYIIYILATEGSCGILESACVTNTGAGVANTARSMLGLSMTNTSPKVLA